MNKNSLAAVIVSYNPEIFKLKKLITSLLNQIDEIIIINNGAKIDGLIISSTTIKIVNLEKNVGLASAQNIGIKIAIKNGHSHILTSDQDSIFPSNFSKNLIKCFRKDKQILCVAPYFMDSNRGNMIEKSLSVLNKKIIQNQKIIDTEVSHVISSGMLFRADAFLKVGYFDERFFIDYIDHDWCFRCISRGFKIYQTSSVIISHEIGDKPKSLLNKKIIMPSGIRVYYYLRNMNIMLFYKQYEQYIKKYLLKRFIKQLVKFILYDPLLTLKYLFPSFIDAYKINSK